MKAGLLQKELEFFESKRAELLAKAKGEYALIRGNKLIGTFFCQKDAIRRGYEMYGNSPFLVKKIVEFEEPVTIYSFDLLKIARQVSLKRQLFSAIPSLLSLLLISNILLLPAILASQSADPDGSKEFVAHQGDYSPLKVGMSWTYSGTEIIDGKSSKYMKHQVILSSSKMDDNSILFITDMDNFGAGKMTMGWLLKDSSIYMYINQEMPAISPEELPAIVGLIYQFPAIMGAKYNNSVTDFHWERAKPITVNNKLYDDCIINISEDEIVGYSKGTSETYLCRGIGKVRSKSTEIKKDKSKNIKTIRQEDLVEYHLKSE